MTEQAEGPADLARVSGIELRHQGGGDKGELPNDKARRGLEEDEASGAEREEERPEESSGGSISIFA